MDPSAALQARLDAAALAGTRAALSSEGVRAKVRTSPEIPGMVLYTGTSDPARRGWWHVGLLDDLSGQELPAPHGRKVLEAWNYGPSRTVSAVDVATVMSLLLASDEDPGLLRRSKQIERMRPDLQQKAFAPREVVADGLIGVQWWDNSGPDTALVLHTFWVSPTFESTHLRVDFPDAPGTDGAVPTPDGAGQGRVVEPGL